MVYKKEGEDMPEGLSPKQSRQKRRKGFLPNAILKRMIKSNGAMLSSKDAQQELDRHLEEYTKSLISVAMKLSNDANRKTIMEKDIKNAVDILKMR
jgi:histone H3/H4